MSSHRLTRIDELHLRDFRHLRADDDCYYLGEYTVRQGFDFSMTNNLVINLKKEPKYRGTPAWKYKLRAIRTCAEVFLGALSLDWLSAATLVPIPPSRAMADPEYDDRILRILRALEGASPVSCDVRELITQHGSYEPSHSTTSRIGPAELRQLYRLAPEQLEPPTEQIAVVDDVLTTGAHFRAAKDLLQEQWPGVDVAGLFVARAVWLRDEDWAEPL